MATLGSRLKHAWNAFANRDENPFAPTSFQDIGANFGMRPDRARLRISNERSIISSIYTRLGIDVSSIPLQHVRTDENGQFVEVIDSNLNKCLTIEANIDQAAQAFRLDTALSLFDNGVIAIVPVDTTLNPIETGGYDVNTMRVGTIVTWYPKHVTVELFNEKIGMRQNITLPKSMVGIVENPLYSVMNEPNSTLQRLITKLNMLDAVDAQSSSGKLDLIIQLPYVVKSEARRQQAAQRRTDIEFQLKGSQYGIAYTDATEKITQLNRPAENNLMKQVEYLTAMLYSQLGLTEEVMNGTADEAAMTAYFIRTIKPIVTAVTEEMKRKFLTSTARTQLQSIKYFRDPFSLVPVSAMAEITDKFTRNEVLSANEIRAIIGFRPSKDPKADKLKNSNMPDPPPPPAPPGPGSTSKLGGDSQNGS